MLNKTIEITGRELREWIGGLKIIEAWLLCRYFECNIDELDTKIVDYLGTKPIQIERKKTGICETYIMKVEDA